MPERYPQVEDAGRAQPRRAQDERALDPVLQRQLNRLAVLGIDVALVHQRFDEPHGRLVAGVVLELYQARQRRRELGVERREVEPGGAAPYQVLGLGYGRGEI